MTTYTVQIVVTGKDNASSAFGKIGGALGNIAQIAGGILSAQIFTRLADGFINLAKQGLESVANYEKLSATLQTLAAREMVNTGQATDMASALAMSGDRAKELLDWVEKLAIKSPFTQQGVADAFRTALAYGFTTEQAQRLTKATIDFAAGSGASQDAMGQIALALGQIQAKGKLSGQEILQLVNAGIPVTQILAKAFGKTTAEIGKMTEQGLIPADKAIEAITASLEGDFGGAAERQANTWAGLMSTFSDLKEIGLRKVFDGIATAIQPLAVRFSEWMQGEGFEKLEKMGAWLGQATTGLLNLGAALEGKGFVEISQMISDALKNVKWEELSAALIKGIQSVDWKQVGQTIATGLGILGGAIVDVISRIDWAGIFHAIDDAMMGVLIGIGDKISEAWAPAIEQMKITMNLLGAIIKTKIAQIKAQWVANWNAFKLILSQVWTIIKSTITTKLNEIKTAFTTAWNNLIANVKTFGSNLVTSIVRSINDAVSGATGALSGFVSMGAKIIGNIIQGLNNAKTSLINYLKSIITGLVNGLFSGGTGITIGPGGIGGDIAGGTYASGTGGWRTVPPGYNNDNYLIGLQSGEEFAVKSKSQVSRGMGSTGGSRTSTNYFNAHITIYAGQSDPRRTLRGLT